MIVPIFTKISPIVHILLATGLLDVLAHKHRNYDIVTDLINALPGNSSVNTVQHTIDETVFSISSTLRPVLLTDQ
jgi:hypothetical protein